MSVKEEIPPSLKALFEFAGFDESAYEHVRGVKLCQVSDNAILLALETIRQRCEGWQQMYRPFIETIESVKRVSTDAGYREGYDKGYDAGREKARQEIRDLLGLRKPDEAWCPPYPDE